MRKLIMLLASVGLILPAHAQSGHEEFHDFYRHWKQPGSELSCCNANRYADEAQTMHYAGDCEPTDAELRYPAPGGVTGATGKPKWFARLPKYLGGDWIEIPEEKVIKEINPDPNRAHLCYSPVTNSVLCFVPPFGGM